MAHSHAGKNKAGISKEKPKTRNTQILMDFADDREEAYWLTINIKAGC
jgi:hypothetical protein